VKLRWADEAWEDYQYWRNTDVPTWKLINALIKQTQQHPFEGRGRPKALQRELKGCWARRINEKDRLVYRVRRGKSGLFLDILQCRGHY
jgi:toxin YoeB